MGGSVKNRASGVSFALSAGILWGFVPLYIHFLGDANPMEIVAHRSLWSLVLLFFLVAWQHHISPALQIFVSKKLLASFIITTSFLSANWIIYVYALQFGHVVSAALGYFIYPICAVLLGVAVLGERLDSWACLAACCVTFGVLMKAFFVAGVPWVALSVAVTF